MGYMKSLLIDQLDDGQEFQLLFEAEPERPDEPESFTSSSLTYHHGSYPNETSLPF